MEVVFLILGLLAGSVTTGFILYKRYEQKLANANTKFSIQETASQSDSNAIATLRNQTLELSQKNQSLAQDLTLEKVKSGSLEAAKSQILIQLQETKNLVEKRENQINSEKLELDNLKNENTELATKFASSDEYIKKTKTDSDLKLREKDQEIQALREENKNLSRELVSLKEQEPHRIEQFKKQLEILNLSIQNQKDNEERLRLEKLAAAETKIKLDKETWARHENEVEEKMRFICQQEAIEYVDKEDFPLSGKPDNCVKICEEYIIFDSKSPQGEDLSNFPSYIKAQADQAKKYAKQNEVRKEIFLVVPNNSICAIKETQISLGEYIVHVITPDAIMPILVQLKRIEGYEFAEQMSPEDRDQIATLIGRMAHAMKRNIQISHFMSKEMISILLDGEKLPTEILEKAQDVERSSKLNPPTEKRKKRIELESLKKEETNITGKLVGQSIHFGDDLKAIDGLPLHISGSNE